MNSRAEFMQAMADAVHNSFRWTTDPFFEDWTRASIFWLRVYTHYGKYSRVGTPPAVSPDTLFKVMGVMAEGSIYWDSVDRELYEFLWLRYTRFEELKCRDAK